MITLHLGQPKTGTSVLQNALVLKSEEQGKMLYPAAFRHPGPGHHALAQSLQRPGAFAKAESELRALLEECRSQDLVFSTEQFTNTIGPRHRPTFDRMAAVCAEYDDLQGVLYIRRYDEFFNSMMLQSMRYGGFRGTPEDYIFQRLNGIRGFFCALRNLRDHPHMRFHLKAYVPGFDILNSFQKICPQADGLDKVGPLPRTEKFTWKQQIFIATAPEILGSALTRAEMDRMVLTMRAEEIRLDGDLTNYCVIPEDLDRAVRDAAIAAAREQGITEYTDAFAEVSSADTSTKKTYVPFHTKALTRQDICVMADLANRPLLAEEPQPGSSQVL